MRGQKVQLQIGNPCTQSNPSQQREVGDIHPQEEGATMGVNCPMTFPYYLVPHSLHIKEIQHHKQTALH